MAREDNLSEGVHQLAPPGGTEAVASGTFGKTDKGMDLGMEWNGFFFLDRLVTKWMNEMQLILVVIHSLNYECNNNWQLLCVDQI